MLKKLILLITITSTIYCESSIVDLLNLQDHEKVCLYINKEFSSDDAECDAAIVSHRGTGAATIVRKMASSLKPGGRALILLSPLDSPEEEMVGRMAQSSKWKERLGSFDGLSIYECKQLLYTLGFTTTHSEVHGKVITFENRENFKTWVVEEIAPAAKLHPDDYEEFAEDFVKYAQNGFCEIRGDGKIQMLTKQLLLVVKN